LSGEMSCPYCDGPTEAHPLAADALACANPACSAHGEMVVYAGTAIQTAGSVPDEARCDNLGEAVEASARWLVKLIGGEFLRSLEAAARDEVEAA
jgi:hypothetical protein